MANPEYMRAREMALKAMSIEPSACVGDGQCCTFDVPITKGDMGIIAKDIRSGKISREIVNASIERSKDPERNEKCPFLDPDNKCSIYESRPLVCITWGIGGVFSPSETVVVTSLDNMVADGTLEETGPGRIRNIELKQTTCVPCRFLTAFDTTSVEANDLANAANAFLKPIMKGGRKYSTMDFAKTDLPQI